MYIINSWIEAMMGKLDEESLFHALAQSLPPLVSVTFTRQCNLQCHHCVYPPATKNDIVSNNLTRIDQVIAASLHAGVHDLIHVGRTLQPSHLPILRKYQEEGMNLHLIDNGSASRLIDKIRTSGIYFNGGIDLSVDGVQDTHELQRGNGSWKMIEQGIKHLSTVTDHISFTSTASTMNWKSIARDQRTLRDKYPSVKLVQLTTTSPARHHPSCMNLTPEQMRTIFQEMLAHSDNCEQHLLLYWLPDLAAILDLLPQEYTTKYISMHWQINKLRVSFFPQSIVPAEEFAIDSNGRHILPFGLDWHLQDRPDEWEMRNDLILTDPDESYRELIKKYQKTLGHDILQQEKAIFSQYFVL